MLELVLLILSLKAMAGEDAYCDKNDLRYLFAKVHNMEKQMTSLNTKLEELNSGMNDIREQLTNITTSAEIDECASIPCQNNGTCVDGINRYTCRCLPGYYGTNCQIEIDECASIPCVNKGTCVDGINRYTCRCLPGYNGTNCQFECKDNSSSLYCNCVDECPGAIDEAICECENGYSNEFVNIPGKVIDGWNILYQNGSSAVECQKLCINTKGCLSCELLKSNNRCFINSASPLTQPLAYIDDSTYDFFARKCLCRH